MSDILEPLEDDWCFDSAPLKTRGASNQSRSTDPDQGAERTAPGRRSLSGARSKYCLFLHEPCGSSWSFLLKQSLTHARQFQIVIEADNRPRMECLCLSKNARRSPRPNVDSHRMGDNLQLTIREGQHCPAPNSGITHFGSSLGRPMQIMIVLSRHVLRQPHRFACMTQQHLTQRW